MKQYLCDWLLELPPDRQQAAVDAIREHMETKWELPVPSRGTPVPADPAGLVALVADLEAQFESALAGTIFSSQDARVHATSYIHSVLLAQLRAARALATAPAGQLSTELEQIDGQARDYAARSRAPNTVKSYRTDWAHFTTWCQQHGLRPLPAEQDTIIRYLTDQAAGGAAKVATLTRRLSSISRAHQLAGHNPISTRLEPLRSVWLGIKRELGTAQKGKAPALTEDIRAMLATLPDRLIGVRDRALLLVGFAGAFRRSELVSLDVGDVEILREGLRVTLRRSKTDQEAAGREVAIPYGSNPDTCPVRVLQAWLEAAGIAEGPLWRSVDKGGRLQPGRLSDKAVALVVKKRAEAAGLDPDLYAGHSLRAGLATAAASAGASERVIMEQTGHRSVQTVRRYIRRGTQFRDNAAGMVGL